MADNKTLPFTGDGDATSTVATDEIGGVDYQRVKMTLGADGVNDGDVSDDNPLPAKTATVAHPQLIPLRQTVQDWQGICVTADGNVYACVSGGGIYMQAGESGAFVDLGEPSLVWSGMCVAPNGDVYAAVAGGDIYVQAGGTGSFAAIGETSRIWRGMCAAPNGDIYAVVGGGDIYVRSGGTGSFVGLGQTSRNWWDICADSLGNVWATTTNAGVYKRTLGAGSFVALSINSSYGTQFAGIAVGRDRSFLYVGTASGFGKILVLDAQNDGAAYQLSTNNISPGFLAMSPGGRLYATVEYIAGNPAFPGDIFMANLGTSSDAESVRTKTNKNRAMAVYLEDWDRPGQGATIGEYGGVKAEIGLVSHDAVATGTTGLPAVKPTLTGGYASAAAPTDVSGDGDAVRAWHLRNGAAAVALTAAGALIGGDATNGLDVDVTRVPTDPFGANSDAAVVTDSSGSISAKLRGLVKLIAERIAALGQAAMSASAPVVIASDQTPVPVGLKTTTSSASYTRPADTTAYAAQDVICNSTSAPTILTFSGMARSAGRGGVITAASLVLGTNPSTKPIFELYLFDTTVTMDNDNAAFTPTDAELATCVAVIPFAVATIGDASSNCIYTADLQKAYLTVGAASLYGVLVAKNAITPTSADTYTIRLTAALD